MFLHLSIQTGFNIIFIIKTRGYIKNSCDAVNIILFSAMIL